jgi:Family of unknown function (DUF6058)
LTTPLRGAVPIVRGDVRLAVVAVPGVAIRLARHCLRLRLRTGLRYGLHFRPKAAGLLGIENRSTRLALEAAVAERFYAVNGHHPMTPTDDAYVSQWYAPLEEIAARAGLDASEVRRLMLANRLPLPSYIRSDGTQMVAADLLDLAETAGGVDALPSWFAGRWASPEKAVVEWDNYLSGQYVCLRAVSPENMQRKDELTEAIEREVADPQPESASWSTRLHRLVDELDEIEPPFAPYDRLRFGGPVSRDRLIDDVRQRYPRTR